MAATSNRQMAYLKFNAILIALIQLQLIPTYIGGEVLTSSGDGYLPAYCIYFCRKPVSSVHRIWNSVSARHTTYIATAIIVVLLGSGMQILIGILTVIAYLKPILCNYCA